jgi:ribonucleotide monophosphatase NagD (HAD superfamily)
LGRLNESNNPAIVIGDQLDRDIAPAKQAGLITVFFPGGFRPKWQLDHEDVAQTSSFNHLMKLSRLPGSRVNPMREGRL